MHSGRLPRRRESADGLLDMAKLTAVGRVNASPPSKRQPGRNLARETPCTFALRGGLLEGHFTTNLKLSLWLLNSGAYMHSMLAMPVWYSPRSWTRVEYSNT